MAENKKKDTGWNRGLSWLTAALALLSLVEAWGMMAVGALHGNDFKHLWLGGWLLGHGLSPYDAPLLLRAARNFGLGGINPYVYLPTTGLLALPLAWMPYPLAQLAWFWLNWLLAWLLVLLGPRLLRVSCPAPARLAGAVFLVAAFPFYRQQSAGQMNVVTAWLILGAAAALLRRRPVWAGLALGLGFAWKLAPALLTVALAPLRRTRAAAWGVAFSIGLLLLSIAFAGWPVHRQALPILQQMGYGQSTWERFGMDYYRDPFNQSPNALLHHLLTENPYTRPWIAWPPVVANRLTLLISALLAALWLGQALRRTQPDNGGADSGFMPLYLAASLAMLLLPSLLWDHYCVQALPALLWVFGQRAVVRSLPRALAALAILAFLTIPWIHQAPSWSHGPGILLMSLRLWPLLGLYLWLLIDRRLAGARIGGL